MARSEGKRAAREDQRQRAAEHDQVARELHAIKAGRSNERQGKGTGTVHRTALSAKIPNEVLICAAQAGICWLAQWNPPPPASTASPGSPIVSRSGNSAAIAATPSASWGEPKVGTTTRCEVIAKLT